MGEKMHVRWHSVGLNLLRETEIKKKLELTQIKRQIEILSTFMPDQILTMPITELAETHNFVGVLLFADVSGFTPLCEKYNKTGKGGIYRLTATLNAYIGALVEVIYFFGGDILKFSGDAFLALWKAPPDLCLYEVIHQVIVCALFIQDTLGCFETEVNVLLKVKLAISCGNMTFAVIGNQQSRHYIITGQAINDVKAAEHVSVSGDVVVAPSAWGHVAEENYEVTFADNGNIKVWSCVYFPNQRHLKESYAKKYVVAQQLCHKHINHRNLLHAKKRIDDVTTDSKITENFIASLPERTAVKNAAKTWIPNELNPFIVRPVQSQVEEKQPIEYLTEMREVTIQFINIMPSTFHDAKLVAMMNKAYQTVCRIVSKVRGVVNKLSLFDKDAMILVLFGLRGVKHELESQNALRSAFQIRKSIKRLSSVKSISIGITHGLVYCGVVGHPFRREYTVIGGAVNKAARIMCAYEGKVTCDHETYKNCKLSSLYFQLQSALKLKGIEDAGYIFEYNEEFDTTTEEFSENMELIGRDTEMHWVNSIIRHAREVGWYGICFRGESKVGKSRILKTVLDYYEERLDFIATVGLTPMAVRPYYTVAILYKQLFDVMTKKNPDVLGDLPRELWDFNEMLQRRSSSNVGGKDDKENMEANFLKLCKGAGDKLILFFIDDIQYIDLNSLDLLDSAIVKCNARLLCAGSFEEAITWNTMWKISLSNRIKLYHLQPLKSSETALLICSFLNVKGVSKKLIILIDKCCEGRPGWVQACLLKLINNGELEVRYASVQEADFAFQEDLDENSIVLVAGFSNKYLEGTEDVSLAAISMDLFDSFSAYQQLIIKTAAVLGEIFTRTILIVLLKFPNEDVFAAAIQTLFEEDVFDCASRYVQSGGLQEKKNMCLCYMEDDEYDENGEYPRYAFCKLLHFKSRNIRLIAYDLLPQNQKKELHLLITDLLESQNNSCPNCLRDNSAALINIRAFNDLIQYCHNQRYVWKEPFESEQLPTEVYKKIIREGIHSPAMGGSKASLPAKPHPRIVRRKVWDPAWCYCLEIVMCVYKDLIHHSHCAEHLGKKVFFMLQYGVILLTMGEFEQAIPVFNEASELCMLQGTAHFLFTGNFRKMMLGKLHLYLGQTYFKMGNIAAAKNHAILSLRQYNIPMISFNYGFPYKLMTRACLTRFEQPFDGNNQMNNILIQFDMGYLLSLVSNIYAKEGYWKLAKTAAMRSITCLRHSIPNLDILCDIFTNVVHLYSVCGDLHVCEKLERCFHRDVLRFYTNGSTCELYGLSFLLGILFRVKVIGGNIYDSIKLGYRSLYVDTAIQAYFFLLDVIPWLAYILMLNNRIDESVHLARMLFNIGKKYHARGYVCYYAFCIELILQSNFFLEPFEKIDQFAREYCTDNRKLTVEGEQLVLGLYCYNVRNLADGGLWKLRYQPKLEVENQLLAILNLFRHTECILIELVRGIEMSKQSLHVERKSVYEMLSKCKDASNKWILFQPRYLHLRAYVARIHNKKYDALRFLKEAGELANKQGNVLEECWTVLHSSYWFGGFSFEQSQMSHINWKLAKTYAPLQLCHVLFALPYV